MTNSVRIAITGSSTDAQNAIEAANRAAKEAAGGGLDKLKGALLSLAPAAIPIAASLVPIAAHMGAGAVAAGAFAAAIIPQVKQFGELSTAQDKATAAAAKYGAGSKQAAEASDLAYEALKALPPETQRAAEAFSILKDSYQGWSDSLAKDTMPVFAKGLAVVNALLPQTTGLVTGASKQFDRLVTTLGGQVSTPGFDAAAARFRKFANESLKSATDEAIHLERVLSQGDASGPISTFMDYVNKTGPEVKDTLRNLGDTLLHVGEAAADAGPGMLSVVNVLAKIVDSVPEAVLTRLVQLYTVLKLMALTKVGVELAGAAVLRLAGSINAAGIRMAAAGGGVRGLAAEFGRLSTATKITGTLAAIAALYLVVNKLTESSRKAPDIDRMTTAIGRLGDTGKVSGEAARIFGSDLSGLAKDIDRVTGGGSKMDHFNDVMNKVFSLGMAKSNSAKQASKDLDALDKSLANLVQGGHADLAAQAIKDLQNETGKKIPTKSLDNYKSALADLDYENKLASESLGLFGAQSLEVQKRLNAQKQSAQGLQQAILDLNDANRAGMDAMSDFEQAIDDSTAAIKGHRNALSYSNGELDLTSKKAREAYKPLSDLASTAEAAATAAIQQGKSQDYANGILIRAHDQLVKAGQQMGLTRSQAIKLADSLDNIKDPKIKVTGSVAQLTSVIADAKRKLASLPKSHSSRVNADSSQLRNVIRDAQARINSLRGKTVPIIISQTYTTHGSVAHEGGGYATGGPVGLGRRAGTAAVGGPRSDMTWVGEAGPELVSLAPGSSVRPHANSVMDARGGGSGGGEAQHIYLMVPDGRVLAEWLLEPMRNLVIRKGRGDVQQTWGKRVG